MIIISNTLVRRSPEARVVHAVIDDPDVNLLSAERLIAELGSTAVYLEIYLYTEQKAVAWSGWIARVIQDTDGNLTIDKDNDPDTRRALYEALH